MADVINPLHDPVTSATYHAPEGESKVVEWQGKVTFLDGVDTPITDPELGIILKGNKLFTVTTEGTPPVARAAAMSHASDDHGRDDHSKRGR